MINWFKQREKKELIIAIAGIAALIIIAVIFFVIKNKSDTRSLPSEKIGRSLNFRMVALNDSGETGMAILEEVSGKVRVTLELKGISGDAEQPVHIYSGSCSKLGPVIYALSPSVNGKSETLIETSLDQLLGRLPLAINVRKSNAEANLSYSCANIIMDQR